MRGRPNTRPVVLAERGRACETDRTMRFVIRVVVNAFAIWVVTLITALQVTIIPFPPGRRCSWC